MLTLLITNVPTLVAWTTPLCSMQQCYVTILWVKAIPNYSFLTDRVEGLVVNGLRIHVESYRFWYISMAAPADHYLSPQNRPQQTEQPSQEDWSKDLSSMPLWRSGPNAKTFPEILLTTTKQGSRYGPLVCPSKPSPGGLQRICSWHPTMQHSRERGSGQRIHHIERRSGCLTGRLLR